MLHKTRGFTIVELLIVIVVIGLLALLVLNNVGGATAEARDAQRETDVQALHSQLEVYQAKNGFYPTTANIADEGAGGWVDTNLEGFDIAGAIDPSGAEINAAGGYAYAAAPALCDNTAGNECTSYTLSADLEEDDRDPTDLDPVDFSKNSLIN